MTLYKRVVFGYIYLQIKFTKVQKMKLDFIKICYYLTLLTLIFSCMDNEMAPLSQNQKNPTGWKSEVKERLEVYGHRNWVVIADAAYPLQSNPAIETKVIHTDQLEAVKYVADLIEQAEHIDANIFIDKEMSFVPENKAKGIESYRENLNKVLKGKLVKPMLHEEIINTLDESANLFNVLILKTNMLIPYTSVFFQLECGYWDSQSEQELREALDHFSE